LRRDASTISPNGAGARPAAPAAPAAPSDAALRRQSFARAAQALRHCPPDASRWEKVSAAAGVKA
jgi:hypothetical protein